MPLIRETGSRLRLIKSAPFHRLPPASGRRREEDAAFAAEGESNPGLRRRRHVAPPRDRDRRLPSGPLGTEEDHRRVVRGGGSACLLLSGPGSMSARRGSGLSSSGATSTESRLPSPRPRAVPSESLCGSTEDSTEAPGLGRAPPKAAEQRLRAALSLWRLPSDRDPAPAPPSHLAPRILARRAERAAAAAGAQFFFAGPAGRQGEGGRAPCPRRPPSSAPPEPGVNEF
jgi:hypothetical protein